MDVEANNRIAITRNIKAGLDSRVLLWISDRKEKPFRTMRRQSCGNKSNVKDIISTNFLPIYADNNANYCFEIRPNNDAVALAPLRRIQAKASLVPDAMRAHTRLLARSSNNE